MVTACATSLPVHGSGLWRVDQRARRAYNALRLLVLRVFRGESTRTFWFVPMEAETDQGDRTEVGLRTRADVTAHRGKSCCGSGSNPRERLRVMDVGVP